MRSRRAGAARPPHRATHSSASVLRSMGPACVHRLRNRPPGVARGHIRIPEECSSTDCVTEHDGRWSWPPRSWLVGCLSIAASCDAGCTPALCTCTLSSPIALAFCTSRRAAGMLQLENAAANVRYHHKGRCACVRTLRQKCLTIASILHAASMVLMSS